jgi:hypothetical protein
MGVACALKADTMKVACFHLYNYEIDTLYGQVTVPTDIGPVSSLVCGQGQVGSVDAVTGEVRFWGRQYAPFPDPFWTSSPPTATPAPTASTAQATPSPAGGAGAGASAVGDPHLQNIHGERFDLMKAGNHVLINIPRGMSADKALLRVQADAHRLGGQCADMYFQQVNITGSWAEAKQVGGLHYSVSQQDVKTQGWAAFGKVELKVVHGRTHGGLLYLNLYVKHLSRAGHAVGGLLGEDDHEEVSIPAASCAHRMALVKAGDF